jgi:hypothetical protein
MTNRADGGAVAPRRRSGRGSPPSPCVANTINIQVDNATVNSAAYSAGVADGANGFRLGAQDNGVDFWNGRIDAVGFWKRVLSGAEVTSLYNSGNGREHPF